MQAKYTSEIYGEAEVNVQQRFLLLVKFPHHLSIGWTHWNFDTFRGYYNSWWDTETTNAQFTINSEGKVTAFITEMASLIKRENPK